MARLILLPAINFARYLSCSILEGRPFPWTTNMCLDRLDFLEKFFPQWLHWTGEQGRVASGRSLVFQSMPKHALVSTMFV